MLNLGKLVVGGGRRGEEGCREGGKREKEVGPIYCTTLLWFSPYLGFLLSGTPVERNMSTSPSPAGPRDVIGHVDIAASVGGCTESACWGSLGFVQRVLVGDHLDLNLLVLPDCGQNQSLLAKVLLPSPNIQSVRMSLVLVTETVGRLRSHR